MIVDNTQAAKDEAELLAGQLLVAAAIAMQSHFKRSVSKSYPPASKPGEYPRWRTGTGREATGYEPEDPKDAGKAQAIRVGWSKAGDHMGILELFRGRRGLRSTAEELAGQIGELMARMPKS